MAIGSNGWKTSRKSACSRTGLPGKPVRRGRGLVIGYGLALEYTVSTHSNLWFELSLEGETDKL